MSMIVNSPLFKLEVKKLERERDASTTDVTRQIREAAPDAIEQLQRTMYTAKSQRLRFDAAKDILDRAGYNMVQKVATVQVSTDGMQDSELKELLVKRILRADESAKQEEIDITEATKTNLKFDEVREGEEDLPSMTDEQRNNLIHILGIKG